MTDTANITPRHVEHREAFWDFVLEQGEPWHREHLSRLFGTWTDANQMHFASRLIPPIILLAETVIPAAFGDCAPISGYGCRSQIRLRPSLLRGTHPRIVPSAPEEGRHLFVEDVLLHEMIHQWQHEVSGDLDEGYHGHGPAFRDKANEIGRRLGLGPVRTSKRRGRDKELPSCSQWPHNVRPEDYYLGVYRDPERVLVPASVDERMHGLLRKQVGTCIASGLHQVDLQMVVWALLTLVDGVEVAEHLRELGPVDFAEALRDAEEMQLEDLDEAGVTA